MAWPEGTPAWLKQAYGVVQAGVNINMSTAELIDSLRPYAAASGQGFGPRGATIVSQLRTMAARIRDARNAVERDKLTGPLRAEHLALAPWARDTMSRLLVSKYAIRAHVSYANPVQTMGVTAEPSTLRQWITVKMDYLPHTLGLLRGYVANAGDDSGSLPGEIDDVHQMEILEI